MSNTPVSLEYDGLIAHLRLNRPEAGNAVDDPMFSLLFGFLEELHARTDLRAVVLSGAGENFCMGRDRQPPAGKPSAYTIREGLRRIVRMNTLLATLPMPTIVAVQGKASGMGAGITVQCNLTVAESSAQFSFPEINHDLPPTIVLSYLPNYLPPKLCFEMVTLGKPVTAQTAQAWGLVNQVVAEGEALNAAFAAAREIAEHSTLALRTIKEYLLSSRGMSTPQAYELGINMLANVTASGEIGLFDKK